MNYGPIIKYRNDHNAFANSLGLRITEMGDGCAKTEMPVTQRHLNPIHSVHGGCLYTVADVTAGAAASSHGELVTTLDGSLHFLRPGLDVTRLYGEAREIKHGKRVSVFEVSVKNQDGIVLSSGIFTFMSLGKPIPIQEEMPSAQPDPRA